MGLAKEQEPATADHARYMQVAVDQAHRALELGEVPVGAVVVDPTGTIIAQSCNRNITDNDPSAHAEINCLRLAAQSLGNYRLPGCRLYVTLEPCTMCVGAMFHARLAMLCYGASDPKTGACGGVIDLCARPALNHHMQVVTGVLADECASLLRAFFRARR